MRSDQLDSYDTSSLTLWSNQPKKASVEFMILNLTKVLDVLKW